MNSEFETLNTLVDALYSAGAHQRVTHAVKDIIEYIDYQIDQEDGTLPEHLQVVLDIIHAYAVHGGVYRGEENQAEGSDQIDAEVSAFASFLDGIPSAVDPFQVEGEGVSGDSMLDVLNEIAKKWMNDDDDEDGKTGVPA